MADISQTNLAEPERVDWDTAFSGSKYQAPPPAIGPDDKPIVYAATIVEVKPSDPDVDKVTGKAYLNKQINLKLTRAGSYDGMEVRTWASTRPFTKKQPDGSLAPIKGNPNALAKLLNSAGLTAKPSSNSEYEAALKLAAGKTVELTLDWQAYNKETQETVRGYNNFPADPERPGQRKSILKAGDEITERDAQGNIVGTRPVRSEVLFANARVKYFQTPRAKK